MATSNRSVKAVLLPKPPIRTKEPGKLRISRNTNTDSFMGMLKRSFNLPDDSNIVLSEDGCQLAPNDFVDGCVDYCKTGDHDIPADSAVYNDAEGKATVEVEVTVVEGAQPVGVSTLMQRCYKLFSRFAIIFYVVLGCSPWLATV